MTGTPNERLKSAREAAGYASPAEFALAAGISDALYCSHEAPKEQSDNTDYDDEQAQYYGAQFGVCWRWLLYGEAYDSLAKNGSVAQYARPPISLLPIRIRQSAVVPTSLNPSVVALALQSVTAAFEGVEVATQLSSEHLMTASYTIVRRIEGFTPDMSEGERLNLYLDYYRLSTAKMLEHVDLQAGYQRRVERAAFAVLELLARASEAREGQVPA